MSDSPLFFLCFSDPSYFLFPVTSAVNNICFGPRLEGPRAAARARPSGGSATDHLLPSFLYLHFIEKEGKDRREKKVPVTAERRMPNPPC